MSTYVRTSKHLLSWSDGIEINLGQRVAPSFRCHKQAIRDLWLNKIVQERSSNSQGTTSKLSRVVNQSGAGSTGQFAASLKGRLVGEMIYGARDDDKK
jgi:hypothetical protein